MSLNHSKTQECCFKSWLICRSAALILNLTIMFGSDSELVTVKCTRGKMLKWCHTCCLVAWSAERQLTLLFVAALPADGRSGNLPVVFAAELKWWRQFGAFEHSYETYAMNSSELCRVKVSSTISVDKKNMLNGIDNQATAPTCASIAGNSVQSPCGRKRRLF